MTRFLTALGLISAIVLVGASATMNALFSFSLGRTFVEGTILCSVSLAVDVMKALLVVYIAWAAREDRKGFVIVGSSVFVLFTVASFLQSMGFVALNRSIVADSQNARALRESESRKALDEMARQRSLLPAHRPIAVVVELIAGLSISSHWAASSACTRPASIAARNFCQSAITLKAEAAAAREAARLDMLIAQMREQFATGSGTTTPDPQARLLADALGLSVDHVRRLLMGLIAIVVELASSLGIYLATGHSRGSIRKRVDALAVNLNGIDGDGGRDDERPNIAVHPATTSPVKASAKSGKAVRLNIRARPRSPE